MVELGDRVKLSFWSEHDTGEVMDINATNILLSFEDGKSCWYPKSDPWEIVSGAPCDDELTTNEEIAMLIRRQTYDERIEMAEYIAMEYSLDIDSVAQVLGAYADLVLE